ncbi:MAG TPA: dephospho-CoA kinase [Paludibacteraceae bacterium]|jgi:dephospho-CoA kinase|nr:dephospho-CoA kinase [Paludibacteraceae bacterium]HQB69425.1 dephospho-CoA kinase [Paludibacteraceae bacterium]HRS67884.1 dephospho-CoA kinase [Paludibacteraceae bacterium]
MIKVGITGGIGSGKSVVADVIRLLGYPVYDSDKRAKELSDSNSDIRQLLVALFGELIYTDNRLNRPLLASYLFQNSSHREAVNAIIHPVVFADFRLWCETQQTAVVFAESAILVESGFSRFMDKILLVDAPQEVRIQRIVERDKITKEQAQQRIAAQMSSEELRECVDYVIVNDNEQLVIIQIVDLINKYLLNV